MQKLIISFAIVFFLFPNFLLSQETPKDFIKNFFNKYESSGIEAAIDELYGTSKWIDISSDAMLQLKTKVKKELGDIDFIGKMHGYEPLVTKQLSTSYELRSYLVKYDRQPIRFTFQFYKPADKWFFYSFKYDAEMPAELEEAAKLYFDLNRRN